MGITGGITDPAVIVLIEKYIPMCHDSSFITTKMIFKVCNLILFLKKVKINIPKAGKGIQI